MWQRRFHFKVVSISGCWNVVKDCIEIPAFSFQFPWLHHLVTTSSPRSYLLIISIHFTFLVTHKTNFIPIGEGNISPNSLKSILHFKTAFPLTHCWSRQFTEVNLHLKFATSDKVIGIEQPVGPQGYVRHFTRHHNLSVVTQKPVVDAFHEYQNVMFLLIAECNAWN